MQLPMLMSMDYMYGSGLFQYPQSSNLLQAIDNKWTPLGYFDGSTYNTVNVPQEITPEWKCFFRMNGFNPLLPSGFEKLCRWSNGATIEANTSNEVAIYGNGIPYTVVNGALQVGAFNLVSIDFKNDSARVTINSDVTIITGITFTTLLSTYYKVMGDSAHANGYLKSWSDCDKTYYPDQTYPEVTLTDPNGTYNDYEFSPNLQTEYPSYYALKEVATGNVNLNPTSNALLPWTLNTYETRVEIDAYDDQDVTFTRPIESNVSPASARGLAEAYDASVVDPSDRAKLNRHNGRLL